MLKHMIQAMVNRDEALAKLKMVTRNVGELTAYLNATADLVICGVTPEQITGIARLAARGVDITPEETR